MAALYTTPISHRMTIRLSGTPRSHMINGIDVPSFGSSAGCDSAAALSRLT